MKTFFTILLFITTKVGLGQTSAQLFVYQDKNRYGFINDKGEIKISARFVKANDFNGGIAVVCNDSLKWGVIDADGNWKIKPIYQFLSPMSEGLICAMIDYKKGYIDTTGNIKIPFDKKYVEIFPFQSGMSRVIILNSVTKRFCVSYINKDGK